MKVLHLKVSGVISFESLVEKFCSFSIFIAGLNFHIVTNNEGLCKKKQKIMENFNIRVNNMLN